MEADWNPPKFVVQCALSLGCHVDPGRDALIYGRLLAERSESFRQTNLLRSQEASDRFWWRLAEDWCDEVGLPKTIVPDMTQVATERLFGPRSEVFRAYEDTLCALRLLREQGVRTAVVSNWDTTLHRVLAMFGIDSLVEFALASLEEGVEKPDPRLFRIALDRLGLDAERVLHVGDHPIDDYEGAKGAGMQAALLDRTQPSDVPYRVRSLMEISEVLESIG